MSVTTSLLFVLKGPRLLRTLTIFRSAFGQIETVALELRVEKLTMDA
jgi:hypothetical protein